MNELQLILTIVALTIFIIFFKQLFSGSHPKRGVDFETKLPNEQIGGINRADKIFKTKQPEPKIVTRVEELMSIANESIEKDDNIEAKKALDALLIIEPENLEALKALGVVYLNMNNYNSAKENFLKLLEHDSRDDITHNLLANTLHKLGEDREAIEHHKLAIKLDSEYAPYSFNYANTLYDIKEYTEALELYKKALTLDPTLDEAKKIIKELEDA